MSSCQAKSDVRVVYPKGWPKPKAKAKSKGTTTDQPEGVADKQAKPTIAMASVADLQSRAFHVQNLGFVEGANVIRKGEQKTGTVFEILEIMNDKAQLGEVSAFGEKTKKPP